MEAWLALAGTILGGVGLKVMESLLGRSKRKTDDATVIRGELRTELNELRVEAEKLRDDADELRGEIDAWRMKYFTLVSAIARGDSDAALRQITE